VGLLVWRDQMPVWAFAVHLVIGVYLGRDVAILSHYNPLIALLVWGMITALLIAASPINRWAFSLLVAFPRSPWFVTGALVAVFAIHLWRWTRE